MTGVQFEGSVIVTADLLVDPIWDWILLNSIHIHVHAYFIIDCVNKINTDIVESHEVNLVGFIMTQQKYAEIEMEIVGMHAYERME